MVRSSLFTVPGLRKQQTNASVDHAGKAKQVRCGMKQNFTLAKRIITRREKEHTCLFPETKCGTQLLESSTDLLLKTLEIRVLKWRCGQGISSLEASGKTSFCQFAEATHTHYLSSRFPIHLHGPLFGPIILLSLKLNY